MSGGRAVRRGEARAGDAGPSRASAGAGAGLAVALDMDETLGFFGILSLTECLRQNCEKRLAWSPDSAWDISLLVEAFDGPTLRPGLRTFLLRLKELQRKGLVSEVVVFTKNTVVWARPVVRALELWLAGIPASSLPPYGRRTSVRVAHPLISRIVAREHLSAFSSTGKKDLRTVFPGAPAIMFDDRPDGMRGDVDLQAVVRVSPWTRLPSLTALTTLFGKYTLCVPEPLLERAAAAVGVSPADRILEPFWRTIRAAYEADRAEEVKVEEEHKDAPDRVDVESWWMVLSDRVVDIQTSDELRAHAQRVLDDVVLMHPAGDHHDASSDLYADRHTVATTGDKEEVGGLPTPATLFPPGGEGVLEAASPSDTPAASFSALGSPSATPGAMDTGPTPLASRVTRIISSEAESTDAEEGDGDPDISERSTFTLDSPMDEAFQFSRRAASAAYASGESRAHYPTLDRPERAKSWTLGQVPARERDEADVCGTSTSAALRLHATDMDVGAMDS